MWAAVVTALAMAASGCAESTTSRHQERRFIVTATRQGAQLEVAVVPRAPWKLAVEFPFEFRIGPVGAEPQRHRAEAAAEATEERLRYAAPVPGDTRAVEATLVFGVCQGLVCERVEHLVQVPGIEPP